MNKEEVVVEAIILGQIDYKDHDAIVNVLTTEGDYMSFYARGIRKPTSRNASSLQAFLFSKITYFKSDKDLKLIKSAKSKFSYYDAFKTYEEILMGHLVLQVIQDTSKMRLHKDVEAYELLVSSLDNIPKIQEKLFLSAFLAKNMNALGLRLVCDGCAVCHREQINYISHEHGGFLCHHCLTDNNKAVYSLDVLKLFRIINKAEYSNLYDVTASLETLNQVLEIMYQFYIDYSGLYIRNIKEFITV